jgi:hypothetical protein
VGENVILIEQRRMCGGCGVHEITAAFGAQGIQGDGNQFYSLGMEFFS